MNFFFVRNFMTVKNGSAKTTKLEVIKALFKNITVSLLQVTQNEAIYHFETKKDAQKYHGVQR